MNAPVRRNLPIGIGVSRAILVSRWDRRHSGGFEMKLRKHWHRHVDY